MKRNKLIGAFISVLIIASGCNAPYHVKKARKHTKKALEKGVVIPKDTVTVVKHDTLVETFTRNDTTYITKYVTKTVELKPTIEIQTRWQTKYQFKEVKVENRAMIDSLKQVVKIERQKKQTARIENRGFKWWWLLIAFALGFVLNNLITLVKLFKLTK